MAAACSGVKGGSEIYISSDGILGEATFSNGDLINAEHLVVHEFAHYFTNPTCPNAPNPCPQDFNGDEATYNYLYQGELTADPEENAEIIRRRSLSTSVIVRNIYIGRSVGTGSEASADIITNWVYGTDFGDYNDEVNDYIAGIVGQR